MWQGHSVIPHVSRRDTERMAHPKRFELLTPRFVVWCSIQLSYGCVAEAVTTACVAIL